MAKRDDKPAGFPLSGKTSDRIRRGEIDADPLAARGESDDRPKLWAVLRGSGRGLGNGASRRRDGSGNDDNRNRRTR
jgi:hypothetical protein